MKLSVLHTLLERPSSGNLQRNAQRWRRRANLFSTSVPDATALRKPVFRLYLPLIQLHRPRFAMSPEGPSLRVLQPGDGANLPSLTLPRLQVPRSSSLLQYESRANFVHAGSPADAG